CFAFFNDSKLGVTLDIKHPAAAALVYRLMARTDIVVENMRPGVMARLGFGYDQLKAHNPGLVMLSTSNLGQTGPRATHPGCGSRLSSLSGFTEFIGASDGPPQCLYGPYIDMLAVAHGGAADLAARLQRSRVHAAIVNTIRDLFDDPQLLERQTWQPHDHPELGRLRYRMGSYQLSETPGRVRSAAPRLGEHTSDVFRTWFG